MSTGRDYSYQMEVAIDISIRNDDRLSEIRTSIRRDSHFFNWKELSMCQLEEIIDLSTGSDYRYFSSKTLSIIGN
jgi:hypothetical protein